MSCCLPPTLSDRSTRNAASERKKAKVGAGDVGGAADYAEEVLSVGVIQPRTGHEDGSAEYLVLAEGSLRRDHDSLVFGEDAAWRMGGTDPAPLGT